MIKGRCFTNLDAYRLEHWPKKFAALPRIGDRVQAKSGRSLKVVCVTHAVLTIERHDNIDGYETVQSTDEPRIRIELHR